MFSEGREFCISNGNSGKGIQENPVEAAVAQRHPGPHSLQADVKMFLWWAGTEELSATLTVEQ